MPGLKLVAIVPPKGSFAVNPAAAQGRVVTSLRDFSADMISAMAKYPPQQPTPYRRTGDLGRGWRLRVVNPFTIEVYNPVAYTVYPQGPKGAGRGAQQTAVMAAKGWQSIDDESERVWARHEPSIERALSLIFQR